jgi:hypothetical protein
MPEERHIRSTRRMLGLRLRGAEKQERNKDSQHWISSRKDNRTAGNPFIPTGGCMKSKTLLALAAASAFLVPLETGAQQTNDPAASARGAASQRGSAAQFNRLDTNKNGSISREEAAAAPDIIVIFPVLDTNSDNQVSQGEWNAYNWAAAPASSSAGASAAGGPGSAAMFNRLDTNSDGMISQEEAAASPGVVVIFTEVDTNKDNQLSKSEWSAFKNWPKEANY